MVDYQKPTGSSGTMMIRDTGSVVEFWLNSNNGSTFVNELPWGYTVNGETNNNRETRYSAGAGWVKFGSWTVTTDQTVSFRIFATGTSGFGGPTTLSQPIDRTSPPNPPSISLQSVSSTQINVNIADGSNNGAAITARQVAVNTINTTVGAGQTALSSATVVPIAGLNPGTLYFFWARTQNARGLSGWSPVKSITTIAPPAPPNQPIVSDPTQTRFTVSFTRNYDGGSPILEDQVGWSTSPDSNTATWETYGGVRNVDGLQPATTYFVWSRVRNAAGWSGLSPESSVRTLAGARIKVGEVWKEAVPYVRDGGTWRLARPFGRIAGVWKDTT